MSGENLDVSPKDLFSHLSKTVEANSKKLYGDMDKINMTNKQLHDDVSGLNPSINGRLKAALKASEDMILRKVDGIIGHLAASTPAGQDHNELRPRK